MDAIYQVYIEGTRDTAPGATARVAQAISARYGFPVADLEARLASGRFRVKSKVDRATAERFAADLRRLGATCVIVDGTTGMPVAPGESSARPATPSTTYSSGLAAAFSAGRDSAPDLGALESGVFSLAALDGDQGSAAPVAIRQASPSFEPPPPPPPQVRPSTPAPVIDFFAGEDPFAPPASEPPVELGGGPAASPPQTPGAVTDRFAPPPADTAMDVLLDVAPHHRASGTLAPEALSTGTRPSAPRPAPRALSVMGGTASAASAAVVAPRNVVAGVRGLVRNERARFVAGVVLAVVLGFVPAHVFAAIRQDAAFTEIDARVAMRQAEVTTRDEWDQLDVLRAAQLERKVAEHRNIALVALALWAGVGGAVAYVWFRRIDWNRFATRGLGTA